MHPLDPAKVETLPLTEADRLELSQVQLHLSSSAKLGVVLAFGLSIGAIYMFCKGHTTDAIMCGIGVVLMLVCSVAMSRSQRRNAEQGTKERLTGYIRWLSLHETEFNEFPTLDIGGVEVRVPKKVYESCQVGELVQVERTSGTRGFLNLKKLRTKETPE